LGKYTIQRIGGSSKNTNNNMPSSKCTSHFSSLYKRFLRLADFFTGVPFMEASGMFLRCDCDRVNIPNDSDGAEFSQLSVSLEAELEGLRTEGIE